MKSLVILQLILAASLCASHAQAQSLKGSPTSIEKQYRAAHSYGFTFVKSARNIDQLITPGQLVSVRPDRYLELHDVSFPYAVPGTKLFLNRLSSQYKSACGEKLTVTSLLRPRDRQPANSVARSVHPTGMAVDLRVPRNGKCRSWLERTLLSLEKDRVLDVTRERRPPHYHVAVYVRPYEARVAKLTGKPLSTPSGPGYEYVVRRGDTLSRIAARTGVKIVELQILNGLQGSLINTGQKLQIPPSGKGQSSADMVAYNEVTHRVTRGDTLWDIASRYGTSVRQLRQANRKAGDYLRIGQVLKISKG